MQVPELNYSAFSHSFVKIPLLHVGLVWYLCMVVFVFMRYTCVLSRFSVCGRVIIDKVPSGLERVSSQKTVKIKGTEVVTELVTNSDGTFCLDLKPGKYIFAVSEIK